MCNCNSLVCFAFLLLYPFVYSKNKTPWLFLFQYSCFDCDLRRRKRDHFFYKKFWSGTKIGNEAGVNLINSLSLTAIFWFIISYISSIGNERRNLRLFFCYGVMQYVTFSLFSTCYGFPYFGNVFFLMLTIGCLLSKKNYYFVFAKC